MTVAGTTRLPAYRCHKVVRAARIVAVDLILAHLTIQLPDGRTETRHGTRAMFAEGARYPEPGDFYVVYEDGYASVSPPGPFLAGYSPANDVDHGD